MADFWQCATSQTTKNYAHWWLKNLKYFKLVLGCVKENQFNLFLLFLATNYKIFLIGITITAKILLTFLHIA
ncbi:hypothetical protein MC5_02240 [Rickettsia australis str. Cutlack]|uniref:Uncharacterized protein n=1 Tax=Rickettsia australis (strain Cutlack) TaxID=1105110 RepID=H8K9W0_RICAC|nr:hypothetical protein MC5_02240 [Rickettsia australis str. Cutlack]